MTGGGGRRRRRRREKKEEIREKEPVGACAPCARVPVVCRRARQAVPQQRPRPRQSTRPKQPRARWQPAAPAPAPALMRAVPSEGARIRGVRTRMPRGSLSLCVTLPGWHVCAVSICLTVCLWSCLWPCVALSRAGADDPSSPHAHAVHSACLPCLRCLYLSVCLWSCLWPCIWLCLALALMMLLPRMHARCFFTCPALFFTCPIFTCPALFFTCPTLSH